MPVSICTQIKASLNYSGALWKFSSCRKWRQLGFTCWKTSTHCKLQGQTKVPLLSKWQQLLPPLWQSSLLLLHQVLIYMSQMCGPTVLAGFSRYFAPNSAQPCSPDPAFSTVLGMWRYMWQRTATGKPTWLVLSASSCISEKNIQFSLKKYKKTKTWDFQEGKGSIWSFVLGRCKHSVEVIGPWHCPPHSESSSTQQLKIEKMTWERWDGVRALYCPLSYQQQLRVGSESRTPCSGRAVWVSYKEGLCSVFILLSAY